MQENYNQYELIDAYLREELQGETLDAFEAELKKNEALRKEVHFRQSMDDVFQLEKVEAIIQQAKSDPLLEYANALKVQHPELESVHDTIHRAKSENLLHRKRIVKRFAVLGVAAMVLLLGWFGNQYTVKGDTAGKWANHHLSIPLEVELTDMATTKIESVSAKKDEVQRLLSEAKQAYKTDKRTEVLMLFEKLRNNYSYETDEMLLHEGLIYYQNNDHTKAIQTLEQIASRNSGVKSEAHWYLGLIYLKINEKDQAEKHFEYLVTTPEQYKKEAKFILKQLN